MLRSLWSGVSGLTTHQMEMDVIGNNIANVNTTAYKSQATGFSDVLYQTVKNGTGAGDNVATTNAAQVGLGSKVSSIYTNITKSGSMQTTGNAFDMMITGDSFFVISPDNQTRNFSRDGAFTIDAQGSLVTQNNGYYVMGVMGEDGIRPGANVTRLDLRTYTLKFNLTDGGDNEDNTYLLSLSTVQDDEGNLLQNTTDTNINLVYDKSSGKLIDAGGSDNGIVTMTFGGGASMIGPLNIDFSNTTNYAGTTASHNSTLYLYKGDVRGLNVGYANGTMTGLSVTDNGSVFAKYSNGQTVKIAQIAVAEFNNAMGLEKVGDNLYAESLNSGEAQIMDVTINGGYLTSGVLESSNVDLSKEFTDMITTQRGFQANSRVITTSDEMLQILRGLKR